MKSMDLLKLEDDEEPKDDEGVGDEGGDEPEKTEEQY